MHFHSSFLFETGQSLLVDFGLCASTRLVFFDIGQALLVDFGLYASTRLVFFDIGFCKYFLISLYLPLWKFLLYFLFVLSDVNLMSKCIWLWSLLTSGSCILTVSTISFCEDKTKSNTFSPPVGSSTC